MKFTPQTHLIYPGIVLSAALLLLPFLGSVHLFDWDEINFAESAREMILTGDYITVQVNYEPFWEKPPLFFWLQVLSMKLFGINEFAARFPNFICGIITFIALYGLGKKIYSHQFGLFWVLSYGAAILPFFYFKSGIIDPWFNLFIFLGISWFIFYFDPEGAGKRIKNIVLSAFLLGLAVLTKGPVALLIFTFCFLIFFGLKRFSISTTTGHVVLFIAVLILTGGTWFLLQVINGNTHILKDFIAYQIRLFSTGDAGHSGFIGYHVVVILLGVFPASVIAIRSFIKREETSELQKLYRQWMYILFWVVLILFSIVKTKILHYSSLTYFPLTFLSAWVWMKWNEVKLEIPKWQVILLLMVAGILSAFTIALPLAATHPDWLLTQNVIELDLFTKSALGAQVEWSGREWLVGAFFFIGVVIAALQLLRRKPVGMWILHLVTLLFVSTSIYLFTSRIEGYSQRAAIEFYKELRGKNVYVETLGFKSYAHLFYFDKQPPEPGVVIGSDSLLKNPVERDAYFVMKVDKKAQYLEWFTELEVIREKNGYVLTVKRASKDND